MQTTLQLKVKNISEYCSSRVVLQICVVLMLVLGMTSLSARIMKFPFQGSSWGSLALDSDDNRPQTNINVAYSGACAPTVGVNISVQGRIKTYQPIKNRVKIVFAEAVKILQGLCPVMNKLDVGIFFNNSQIKLTASTDAKLSWQIKPVEITTERDGYTPFRLVSNSAPAGLRVDSKGNVEGFYEERGGLYGRMQGLAVIQNRNGQKNYVLDGMLYDHGDAKRKCLQAREGYAFWGAYQFLIPSEKRIQARGTFWPCGKLHSDGKAVASGMMEFGDIKKSNNPFNKLKSTTSIAKNVPDTSKSKADKKIVLASGKKWRLTTEDANWCLNGSPMRLDYDVPHQQRDTIFTGGYQTFIRQLVEPKLLKTCPAIQLLSISNYRKGESHSWDSVDLFKSRKSKSGLRVTSVTRGRAFLQVMYNQSCAGCHATGAGGAPIAGIKASWNNRPYRLERAASNLVYHFNKLHCPNCEIEALEALNRILPYSKDFPKPTVFNPRQKSMMNYAKAPTVKNLLESGLLNDAEIISNIYHNRTAQYPEQQKLRQLFRDFIGIYDRRCGSFLPGNAKTYTFTYTDRDVQHTVRGRVDTISTKAGRGVRMQPQYYNTYARNPGANAGLSANLDEPLKSKNLSGIMGRTADTRALLANNARCTDPTVQQYISNLHAAVK